MERAATSRASPRWTCACPPPQSLNLLWRIWYASVSPSQHSICEIYPCCVTRLLSTCLDSHDWLFSLVPHFYLRGKLRKSLDDKFVIGGTGRVVNNLGIFRWKAWRRSGSLSLIFIEQYLFRNWQPCFVALQLASLREHCPLVLPSCSEYYA